MRRRDTRGGDYEDGIRKHHNDAAYTKSAGSESNGGSSSSDDDGDERSTTESIPDENEATGQSTATLTAAGTTTTAPQPPPPPPAVLTGSGNDSSNQPQINPQPQDDSINIKKRKLTTKRDRKQKKKKKLQQQKQNQKQKAQLREEIPEATLARLTSSYSVAMEAVGALHRVSRQYCHYWREKEAAAAAASTVTQNTEVVTNSGHAVVDGDDDNDDDAASSKEKNAVIEIAKEARNLVGNANDKDNTNNDEIMATDESLSKNEDIKTKETNIAMDLEKEDTSAAAPPPQPTAPIKTQQQEEINNDLIDEKLQKYHTTIQTVAHAARTALEHSLLLDPVILAPILIGKGVGSNSTSSTKKSTSRNGSNGGMNNANRRTGIATKSNSSSVVTNNGYFFNQHDYYLSSSSSTMDSSRFTSAWQSVWDCENTSTNTNNDIMEKNSVATAATATCLMKWNRLSAAHHTVVTQIAYLSLVNYADLLLCGCTCHRLTGATSAAGISNCGGGDVGYTSLDRGAVTNLEAVAFFPLKKVIKTQSTQSCNNAASSVQYETENPSQNNYDFNSHHSSCCLWSNESRERTIRLALASYCDASELDPSDPTLWFKLACAARALGREVDSSSSPSTATTTPSALLSKRQTIQTRSNGPPKSYRCLERLALERGMSSLPPGVPPNRMLMRAWREMEEWDRLLVHVDEDGEGHGMESDKVFCAVEEEDVALPATATPPEDNNGRIQLVIHLPKYSWLTLGRILLRACREGAAYGRSLPVLSHVWSTVSCFLIIGHPDFTQQSIVISHTRTAFLLPS